MRQITVKFSNRVLYTFILIGILVLSSILVYAVWDSSKTVWHSAEDVKVVVGGTDYSLQESIDGGTFGGSIPSGAVMAFDLSSCPAGWTELTTARGRVIVGLNTADSSFNSLGKTGGEKTHTLTIAEMPSHRHSYSVSYTGYGPGGQASDYFGITSWTANTNYEGGDQPHNNLQPYITLLYCKKN